MATDLFADFTEQYSNVAAKLKKRFLRKPNLQEVLSEFHALANQCVEAEQTAIAGQTLVMAAKCENSLGNALGEADCFVAAARQFMKEEQKLRSMKFDIGRENLESSISCYIQAASKYPEDSPLRYRLFLELAHALHGIREYDEAVNFYEQAVEILPRPSGLHVKCLTVLMDMHIETNNHKAAFDVCCRLCAIEDDSMTTAVQREIFINGILLSLLVETSQARMPQCLKTLFSSLESDCGDFKVEVFEPNLSLNIESIYIAYSNQDRDSLAAIYSDSSSYFTILQRELLYHLMKKLEDQ